MDLKEIDILDGDEGSHWYYASKSLALLQCLRDRGPREILDVGAGSGFFSKVLLRETAAAAAVCVDPAYELETSEVCCGKPIAFRRKSRVETADVVLMMDVIEHVDDDVALVREYVQTAPRGTRFVVSVPAFSWLWSTHDEFLGHRRRYTLDGLGRVLADAGLVPAERFYFFAALFPAAAAQRLWRRIRPPKKPLASELRRHHPFTNAVAAAVCRAECRVARHNRLFGLSAFAVAEKV